MALGDGLFWCFQDASSSAHLCDIIQSEWDKSDVDDINFKIRGDQRKATND